MKLVLNLNPILRSILGFLSSPHFELRIKIGTGTKIVAEPDPLDVYFIPL